MLEKEVKIELGNKHAFQQALNLFTRASDKEIQLVRQINHYLDTGDLTLARSLVMFRLRLSEEAGKEKKALLTFKSGTQIEEGYFQSKEIESMISPELSSDLLADPCSLYKLDLPPIITLRKEYGELPLELVGILHNERRIFYIEGYTVELDTMKFQDGEEAYEVELESENPRQAREWCLACLKAAGIGDIKPATCTKFQRLTRKMGM